MLRRSTNLWGRGCDRYSICQLTDGALTTTELMEIALLRRDSYIERWPTATPPPLSVMIERLQALRAQAPRQATIWIARTREGEAVGVAMFRLPDSGRSEATFDVYVRPNCRRQGIARRLLRQAKPTATRSRYDALRVSTFEHITEAGAVLARRCDGVVESVLHHGEIPIEDCSAANVIATNVANGSLTFSITDGLPCSDEVVHQLALLGQSLSQRYGQSQKPRGAIDIIEGVRKWYAFIGTLKMQTWLVLAYDADGSCVGYSEYRWDPHEPDLARHIGMAVHRKYRGGSLATRLVAFRRDLLQRLPMVTRIRRTRQLRTVTAPSRLMPTPHLVTQHYEVIWQVPLNGFSAYAM